MSIARTVTILVAVFHYCSVASELKVGALTHDYGLLTDYDLFSVMKNVSPECWRKRRDCPTEYWQCLRLDSLALACEALDKEGDALVVAPLLTVRSNRIEYEYFTRRPGSAEDCRGDISQWSRILQIGDAACFSASIVEETKYSSRRKKINKLFLELGKIKSPYGRWSYFCEDGWGDNCQKQ